MCYKIMILSPVDLSRMNTLFARVQNTWVLNAKGPETNYTASLWSTLHLLLHSYTLLDTERKKKDGLDGILRMKN